MSIAKELIQAIEVAIRSKSFDDRNSVVRLGKQGSYLFDWKSGEVALKGELLQEDSIGVLVNWLELYKDVNAETDSATYLKEAGEAIVARIRYLNEPLRVVEMDTTTNAIQIRSEKPLKEEGHISYFEMILKTGKWFGYRNYISVHRYSQKPDEEPSREVVAFPVTKLQFEKLLNDLIEIL